MQSTKYLSPRAKSQRKRRGLRTTRPEGDRPRGERSEGFGVGKAHDVTGKRRALVGHGRFGREFDPTVATPPRTFGNGYEFHLEHSPVSVFEEALGAAACFWSNLGTNAEFLSELETCMESNSAAPHDPGTLSGSISGVHIFGRKSFRIFSTSRVHKNGYRRRSLPGSSLAPSTV